MVKDRAPIEANSLRWEEEAQRRERAFDTLGGSELIRSLCMQSLEKKEVKV